MTSDSNESVDEPDLGALMARVLPRLAALEEPILCEAGLSMWEYAIVTELESNPGVSQAELSRRTRRDPTRLGRHLEDLDSRGIVTLERASDQRQNAVRLTRKGRTLYEKVKESIRTWRMSSYTRPSHREMQHVYGIYSSGSLHIETSHAVPGTKPAVTSDIRL